MIPVVVIILLIILLIYKLRTPPEEYKIEGLSLSWVNKANIEGTVTKWVFVIKDKDGVEIHRATDNESKNLKDFSAVTVDIIDNKEFDEKIIGDNTLELYYNEVNAENLLYTKIIQFSKDDFTSVIDMDGLEEIAEPPPPPPVATTASPLTEIPYQATSGIEDSWCWHPGSVHQDVPGCGRICSDSNYNGRKNENTWAPWKTTPVNCPAARLDDIWKEVNGVRTLKVGLAQGALKWSLYTGAYFPDIASFSNKTVQASGTTTSIPNISTGTGGVGVLKDTPENMRRASSIWSGEAIGVGHGRGRLDSEQGWSSQHNIVGQWYGIDNGVVGKITGIAIKARKYYNQWVKTFKVQYKGASGTWANVDGGKTYTGNTDKDTQVDVFFDTPVEASSIRIYPQTWNEHMSMRCDIFVGGVISGDINSVSRSDYAVHWQGYFVPKITGDHTFWTESDDMSYLTIDGAIVVDNGGLHGMVEKNGKINLTKDKRYKLDIYFSEKGGGDEIIVRFFHTGMSEWTTDFNGYLR